MSGKRSKPWTEETPPVTALNLGLTAVLAGMMCTFLLAMNAGDYLDMLACSAGMILVNAYVGHGLNGDGPARAGMFALAVAFASLILAPLAWYLMNQFFLPRFTYMRYAESFGIAVGGIIGLSLVDSLLVMFAGCPLWHVITRNAERNLRKLEERGKREGEDDPGGCPVHVRSPARSSVRCGLRPVG